MSIDPAPILGEWSNTNRGTWGIGQIELSRRNGGIGMRIVAADPVGGPHDWGWSPVATLFTEGPGSGKVCGYTATFDLGHARTHLQANANFGVTVLAAFTVFTDGSGRSNYLTREYYNRHAMLAAPAPALPGMRTDLPAARGDDRLPMLRARIDPAPLVSRWRNAEPTTRGVSEVHCELRDGELVVRVLAVGPRGPVDWGEVVATPYSDLCVTGGGRAAIGALVDGHPTPHYADVGSTEAGPAFWATFDLGFQRIHLQARVNLGVLVVAMFTEFTDDSGRANYFYRELFIRQP